MDNGVYWDNDEEGIAEGALQRIQRIQRIYEEFQQRAAVAVRIQRRYPERVNPADRLTDAVFKSHFRLDKLSALRLVDLLGLHQLESNRGLPLHPMQSLCICLSHFAGGQFQRVSALCGGEVSKSSAQRCITKVRDRILELKNEYIKMPTREEREETAAFMLEKYHLPGFAYGIDGMVVKFEELPRGIPQAPGYPVAQSFWTRKDCPGVPVLTLGNHRHLILATDQVYIYQCVGSGSAWMRKLCLDPDPDKELQFRIRIQLKVNEHRVSDPHMFSCGSGSRIPIMSIWTHHPPPTPHLPPPTTHHPPPTTHHTLPTTHHLPPRAVDPHSFYAYPDPSVFLNDAPHLDPGLGPAKPN